MTLKWFWKIKKKFEQVIDTRGMVVLVMVRRQDTAGSDESELSEGVCSTGFAFRFGYKCLFLSED